MAAARRTTLTRDFFERGYARAGKTLRELEAGTGPGSHDMTPGEAGDELTPVTTRLGPEELATVNRLITSGVASSRAEVLRWALSRIRQHPAT